MRKTLLTLINALLAISCYAQKVEVDNLKYYLNDDEKTASVSGCLSTNNGSVEIPSEIKIGKKTYQVTSVGYGAFMNNWSVKSVKLPESITYIGRDAFAGSDIENIEVPNGVKKIDYYAFAYCDELISVKLGEGIDSIHSNVFDGCLQLKEINFPSTIKFIGYQAFLSCLNLTTIKLPEALTYIGYAAFAGTNIKEVFIPKNVETIRERAFACEIENIRIDPTNKVYDSRNDCNSIISTSTNTLLQASLNTVIPNTVTAINKYAFDSCDSLKNITIPASVTNIDVSNNWNLRTLTQINVSKDNKTFDSRNNCNAIIETKTNKLILGSKNTKIPQSTKTIGKYAFSLREIENITIPEGVEKIDSEAFACCKYIKEIRLPNTLKSFESNAFSGMESLKTITLPNSLISMPRNFLDIYPEPETIISYILEPDRFHFQINKFKLENTTLYVPKGTLEKYNNSWGCIMKDVIEMDDETTNIKKSSSDIKTTTFNMLGSKSKGNSKGINIVKYSNGNTRKVIVK